MGSKVTGLKKELRIQLFKTHFKNWFLKNLSNNSFGGLSASSYKTFLSLSELLQYTS